MVSVPDATPIVYGELGSGEDSTWGGLGRPVRDLLEPFLEGGEKPLGVHAEGLAPRRKPAGILMVTDRALVWVERKKGVHETRRYALDRMESARKGRAGWLEITQEGQSIEIQSPSVYGFLRRHFRQVLALGGSIPGSTSIQSMYGETWADLPPKLRARLEATLEAGETPWLVTDGGFGEYLIATDVALVRVRRGRHTEPTHDRYPFAEMEDLHPSRNGSLEFTWGGAVTSLKYKVFWPIVRRFPGLAKEVLVQEDELALAGPADFSGFEIGCFLGEKELKVGLLEFGVARRFEVRYARFSVPILTRRRLDVSPYFQLATCPVCAGSLAVRITPRSLDIDHTEPELPYTAQHVPWDTLESSGFRTEP